MLPEIASREPAPTDGTSRMRLATPFLGASGLDRLLQGLRSDPRRSLKSREVVIVVQAQAAGVTFDRVGEYEGPPTLRSSRQLPRVTVVIAARRTDCQRTITIVNSRSIHASIMGSSGDEFHFDYFGTDLYYGRGIVETVGEHLEAEARRNALIVCGSNVGANEGVMNPLRRGLDPNPVEVFDRTTPAKAAETLYEGIEVMEETDPDVIIGVGGGSSLDIARQMSVFAADGRSLSSFLSAIRDGTVDPPDPEETPTPVITIPTTLAGACLSDGGSIEFLSAEESPTGQPVRIRGSMMPEAVYYDPSLYDTTPTSALTGSAMNGFNKGIETIYSSRSNPITDATAMHGLRLFGEALPRVSGEASAVTDTAVKGLILVQFRRKTSIIHAFGHGFSYRYPIQQGVIHGVTAPHVLEYLFQEVDGRRERLAEGLGIDPEPHSKADCAAAVVQQVDRIRHQLGLPARLRDIPPVRRADIPDIAEFVLADIPSEHIPADLELTEEAIADVLERAW